MVSWCQRTVHCLLCLMLAVIGALGFKAQAHAEIRDLPSITVLAPVSLTESLTEIARNYSREKGISVVVSFATTRTHFETVTEGEPADVFITDDTGLMRDLKNQGLIDVYAQTSLMVNPLVVFTDSRTTREAEGLSCLPDVIGEMIRRTPVSEAPYQQDGELPWLKQDSAEGTGALFRFTREMQNRQLLKTYSELREWLLCRPLYISDVKRTTSGKLAIGLMDRLFIPHTSEARPKQAADVRAVIKAVEEQPHAIGITHHSDLKRAQANGVAVKELAVMPAEYYTLPLYQAFVVAGENMPRGREFVSYLKDKKARAVFTKGWFEVE